MRLIATLIVLLAMAPACAEQATSPTATVPQSRETVQPTAPRAPTAPAAPTQPVVAAPTAAQIRDVRAQIAVAQANVDSLGNIGEPSTKTLQQARTRVSELKSVLEIMLRQQVDAASAIPAQ